jgi:hypothetical protein
MNPRPSWQTRVLVELAVRTVSVRRVTARKKTPRNSLKIGTPGIGAGFKAHLGSCRCCYTAMRHKQPKKTTAMIIQIATALVFAAACLATITTIAAAPALAARRTVVVKRPPMVSPRDVAEAWDARQNVLDSKRYE